MAKSWSISASCHDYDAFLDFFSVSLSLQDDYVVASFFNL
jgi:hypothetical protein